MNIETKRLDHRIIAGLIEPGSKVLDLGCGNGDLMYVLVTDKNAIVQGIEIDDEAIHRCVEKGLSVFHGDIDSGLAEYPDKSFDYVILNQSMQQVKRFELVLHEALRIGRKVIVGFPNFGYISARFMLFFRGKAPITQSLAYRWFDTPNIRFLTESDFRDYCQGKDITISAMYSLGKDSLVHFWPNLFALNAVFVIEKEMTHVSIGSDRPE
jgi:methionine biosynthesis protein MetW